MCSSDNNIAIKLWLKNS